MDVRPGGGAESQVTFFGHAVHPMLIPFPIAFLCGAAAADGAFLWLGDPFWARMAFWLLLAGVVMGAVAGLVGMADFILVRPIRRHMSGWNHMVVAILTLAFGLVNLLQRLEDAAEAVWPWGLVLSLVTVVMVGITGWMGGKMVFEHNLGPGEPLHDAPEID